MSRNREGGLILPSQIVKIAATNEDSLKSYSTIYGDTTSLPVAHLSDEALSALLRAAEHNPKERRVIEALISSRSGDFNKPMPSAMAAPGVLTEYLKQKAQRGWVFMENEAGHLDAWLVTNITYTPPEPQMPASVGIYLVANGAPGFGESRRNQGALGRATNTVSMSGAEVAKKRPDAILAAAGLLLPTEELLAIYDEETKATIDLWRTSFAQQYRYDGSPVRGNSWSDDLTARKTKVVGDLHRSEIAGISEREVTVLSADDEGMAVPVLSRAYVFDLATHKHLWVDSRDLALYEYDKSLREKIVLPEDQRNLLDILTTDLSEYAADIVEGKSTGNVILAKGKPGVGKTLTAEVYAEIIERPLYSIHSGNLGTDAESIRKNLEMIFKRAKRWNAVLLLDEADVFVLERGDRLDQNAIVAEFLRTLEYFDGLLFMTTNRANDIDDAILSRAAAVIDYKMPDVEATRAIWKVQADQQQTDLPEDLLDALVGGFADISPRDIKMLLRLALRMAKGNGEPLSPDLFARCAMFRGLHYQPGSRA